VVTDSPLRKENTMNRETILFFCTSLAIVGAFLMVVLPG
jgi:hypothetical protein